jgi:hypothetical protein
MVVRWEDTGIRQTLPVEEFRHWDKATVPPPMPISTPHGNTTPKYLVALREERAKHPEKNRKKERKLMEAQLAKDLIGLSDKRKNRTKNKAKKLIANFDRNMPPLNMSRKFTPEQVEASMTKRGGFSRESLANLGVPWPPPKGWRAAITIGRHSPLPAPVVVSPSGEKRPCQRTPDEWMELIPRLRHVAFKERLARDDRHDAT